MDTQNWTSGGRLNSREAFYFDETGNLAVERDHYYLLDATVEEKEEIYRLAPHLIKEALP